MPLSQGHDGLVIWAMIDQDLEHAIKWRFVYTSQEILREYENIQGWQTQSSTSGVKLVNTQSTTNVPHVGSCELWSFHGLPSNGNICKSHERISSSVDVNQSWEVQFQDENIKDIICLKLGFHFMVMDMWRYSLVRFPLVLMGRNLRVFTKQAQSRKVFCRHMIVIF
jgi:hypothetical protein